MDGHYGSSTKAAFAAWQRSLGFTGLAANGLPGITSLTQLAGTRFVVRGKVNIGPRVQLPGGSVVSRRTNRMKMASAKLLASCKWSSRRAPTTPAASPSRPGRTTAAARWTSPSPAGCGTRRNAVRALRSVGFAAWFRPKIEGLWDAHIHAIAVNDTDLAAGAANQVSEYYRGFDGLDGDGPDTGPQVPKVTWEQYKRTH